jgi:hypothetical protein
MDGGTGGPMRRLTFSNLYSFLAILILLGCSPNRYQPPPITTPGSVDLLRSQRHIPVVLEWKYEDHMLLYRPDCNECRSDLALFSWNWRKDEMTEIQLPGLPTGRLEVAESSDPNLIVYAANGKIHLYNLMNYQDEQITDGGSPEFSPKGDQVIFQRNQDLILLDLKTRQEQVMYSWHIKNPNHKLWIYRMNWSSDGNKIAYIWEENYLDGKTEDRIAYIDVNSKEEKIIESGQFSGWVSWSPDSRLLTYVRNPLSDQAQLIIFEPSEGCVVGIYPVNRQDGTALWSPDGKVILVRYFGDLFFINVEKVFGEPYNQLSCIR